MGKVKVNQDLSNITTLPDLVRYGSIAIGDIISTLNGRVSFTDNADCQLISVTFASANLTVQVPHMLRRVPTGYIEAKKSANMVLFDGDSNNTTDFVYLQSSAAGTASVLVF